MIWASCVLVDVSKYLDILTLEFSITPNRTWMEAGLLSVCRKACIIVVSPARVRPLVATLQFTKNVRGFCPCCDIEDISDMGDSEECVVCRWLHTTVHFAVLFPRSPLGLRRSQFPSLRCPVPSVPDFSRSLGSAVVVVVLVVLTVC